MPRSAKTGILKATASAAVVWAVYCLRGGAWLRAYPAVVVGCFLVVFAISLRGTPLVERFARGMGENLDARGVAYCRKATVAWTVFLAVHFAVTTLTVFASPGVWAVYNGCVAYALIGAMFLGEYVARRIARNG